MNESKLIQSNEDNHQHDEKSPSKLQTKALKFTPSSTSRQCFFGLVALVGLFVFQNASAVAVMILIIFAVEGWSLLSNPKVTCRKFPPVKNMISFCSVICFCVIVNCYLRESITIMVSDKMMDNKVHSKAITNKGSSIQDSLVLPERYVETMHVHLMIPHERGSTDCGGCMVLWELYDSILDLNMSATNTMDHGIHFEKHLDEAQNKTIVILYPEISKRRLEGIGNRVHVHWILAPLGKLMPSTTYQNWGDDDLVFNYASSTSIRPDLLPPSNILQVITAPREGDDTDLSTEAFYSKEHRNGVLWTMRKGKMWHRNITYIHNKYDQQSQEMNSTSFQIADFKQYEYFVSYDPYTFYSYLAAMMGAISIVHPLENVTKHEWALGTYVGEYLRENEGEEVPGIAYGWTEEEIQYANNTKTELRNFLIKVRRWGKENTVSRFLRDCYRYGRGERSNFEGALLVREAYNVTYWDTIEKS